MKILFATNNAHKTEEVRAILDKTITLMNLSDFDFAGEIPETSPTLEGNALQKARFIHHRFGVPCFADDTGLEVEALDNAPGALSARYAGEGKNPDDNMRKLLRELEGKNNRNARFRCVIAYIDSDSREYLFEGVVGGEILRERRGDKGFGYDPLFRPHGFSLSFAEMSEEDKNRISHRGEAVRKLALKLRIGG
jgi:XTP/dITP diphosphohydrolase